MFSISFLQVSRTTGHLVWHRVARARYTAPTVLSVACDVVPHVLKGDALFALQNCFSSVAYVDVDRFYSYGVMYLRKPCPIAAEMLSDPLVTV